MIADPGRTVAPGATVHLILTFQHAGTVTVEAAVRGYPTAGPSAGTP